VKLDPASIKGYVYVDKDNDGVRDAGEKPIANVILTLTGNDITGAPVTRTTITDASGFYNFPNLIPGTYNVAETHPVKYKDGKDAVGLTFNSQGQLLGQSNGFPGLDSFPDDGFDADFITNISLDSGYAALDYNFGELAVNTSKTEFIRRISYR
jgi:hypothetical protein